MPAEHARVSNVRAEPLIDDVDSCGKMMYPTYADYQKDLLAWEREVILDKVANEALSLKKDVWNAELRIAGVVIMAATSHWILGMCIFLSPFAFWFLEEVVFQMKHIGKPADEIPRPDRS